MSVFDSNEAPCIIGLQEKQLHKELEEHVTLAPERNDLEHTKFMNKLQIVYYLDEIEEKR
jgi:hypothetical protein